MEAFESLLQMGIDVNASDDDCTPPLVYAAISKRLEMVKALVASGADVNAGNRHGNKPLIYAAGAGDEEMTRALIDAGVDANGISEGLVIASRYPSSESHRRIVQLLKSRRAVQ